MQDLASAIRALKDATDSIKTGGWMAVVVLVAILAFLLLKPVLARGRKATQEVTVTVPAPPANGNGHTANMIQDHVAAITENKTNIVNLNAKLETMRAENRQDHQQIFNAINSLKA